jgi:hypothetical protein
LASIDGYDQDNLDYVFFNWFHLDDLNADTEEDMAHAFQATAAALTQLSDTIAAFSDEYTEHFGATITDYLDHSVDFKAFHVLDFFGVGSDNCLVKSNKAYPSTIHWLTIFLYVIDSHGF